MVFIGFVGFYRVLLGFTRFPKGLRVSLGFLLMSVGLLKTEPGYTGSC